MSRTRVALVAGAVALIAALTIIPLYAHEEHAAPVGGSFDPDTPRVVSEATAIAIGLATAEVDFGTIEDVVRLAGVVRAEPASLRAVAPIYGGVLRSINAQPGDRVTSGMLLAEMDSPEIAALHRELRRVRAEVASMEINALALKSGADLSDAEVQRLAGASESVPGNLLAQRRAEAIKLRAEADVRQLALAQARVEAAALAEQLQAAGATSGSPTGIVRLVAPIDGVVLTRSAVVGAGVASGQTLVTIGDLSRVQIEGELPDGLVDRVAQKLGAGVRIRPGARTASAPIIEGVVAFASPTIHPITRTAQLIVDADNAAGQLRPGQFADLSVVVSASDSAVVVPLSAVVKEGPLQYVFVKEGEGDEAKYLKRDIATGLRDDRQVEILHGLVPGDIVVVRGAFSLSQLRGSVPGGTESAAPAESGHGHSH